MLFGHDLSYWLPVVLETATIIGAIWKSGKSILGRFTALEARLNEYCHQTDRNSSRIDFLFMTMGVTESKQRKKREKTDAKSQSS